MSMEQVKPQWTHLTGEDVIQYYVCFDRLEVTPLTMNNKLPPPQEAYLLLWKKNGGWKVKKKKSWMQIVLELSKDNHTTPPTARVTLSSMGNTVNNTYTYWQLLPEVGVQSTTLLEKFTN